MTSAAELRGPEPRAPGIATKTGVRLGVVIVTRNRAETLLNTLSQLTALNPGYPIVVVDNASTDGTIAKVQRACPCVHTMSLPVNFGAVARNYGARRLSCDYIAFCDDDSWWQAGSFEKAIAILDEHPTLALLVAQVLAGTEKRLDPTSAEMRASPIPKQPGLPGVPVLGFMGCSGIVRRDAFLSVGGFHEWFRTGGEESFVAVELANAGWDCAYVDDLIAYHMPSAQRDMAARYVEGHANRIWEAWLQRPISFATRITTQALVSALTDAVQRKGLLRALTKLPQAISQRRVVNRSLEIHLRMLEAQRGER